VRRPRIGIASGPSTENPDFFTLRDDYPRAVEAAGGLPVVLVTAAPEEAAEHLAGVDALLLTGGADVDPSFYGAAPHPALGKILPRRDAFEIALVRRALEVDLPVLAICRGHQVLNVATGGTLVQDIPSEIGGGTSHDPDVQRWEMAHDIRVLPGSRLHEILGRDRLAVNSFHHQAVRSLGNGLRATAWSAGDEIVEGIEMPDRRFVVGVQWHPESFWDHGGVFQPLFEAVVRAGQPR
jgi:putative glutamine amidotransferase